MENCNDSGKSNLGWPGNQGGKTQRSGTVCGSTDPTGSSSGPAVDSHSHHNTDADECSRTSECEVSDTVADIPDHEQIYVMLVMDENYDTPGVVHSDTLNTPGVVHSDMLNTPDVMHSDTLNTPGVVHSETLNTPGVVRSDLLNTPLVMHSGTLKTSCVTHSSTLNTEAEEVYTGDTGNDSQIENLVAFGWFTPGTTTNTHSDSENVNDQCNKAELPLIAVPREEVPNNGDTCDGEHQNSSGKENSCTPVHESTGPDQHPVADGTTPQSPVSGDSDSDDVVTPSRRRKAKKPVFLESDSDDNQSDISEGEVSFKKTKKAKKIESDSEEDSVNAEKLKSTKSSSSKKLKSAESSPSKQLKTRESTISPRKKMKLGKSRLAHQIDSSDSESDESRDSKADTVSGSSGEESIKPDEVDTSAIISDEEKQGRKESKRKFLSERSRKLREVKKNWKKRRSVESNNNSFKRILSNVGSESDSSSEVEQNSVTGSPNQQLSSDEESLDGFIIEADTAAAEPCLGTYLPKIVGQNLSLREAFTHYLSVLVNGAIDPDLLKPQFLRRSDDYVSLLKPSLRKIQARIDNGLAVVNSAAWKRPFRTELESRPCMRFIQYDKTYDNTNCEACRLDGRIASVKCRFSGPVYDRETLLIISQREPSEGDGVSAHSQRETLTEIDEEFAVGGDCSFRSRIFHQLYHYRFNLLKACRRKVKKFQKFRQYDSDGDIFDHCMQDTEWIDSQFDRLNEYLDETDYYAKKD